jgi:cyclic pyranopterin phosphate synthase
MIADAHGRIIRYLRLSLTPACAMRCIYCRPAALRDPAGGTQLTAQEIQQLVGHLAAAHGLRKVRLTGGEPTQRADLIDIIRSLAGIRELGELAMTTNGLTLHRQAAALVDAGLHRVNVSLDSLDPRRFHHITGVDGLDHILRGIATACRAGLSPLKLNTVVVRGQNDHELPELLQFAAARGLEIRFIELMPMGPLAGQWAQRYVPEAEMRQTLDAVVGAWTPLPCDGAAARGCHAELTDGSSARVGFITAMSCPFCDGCSRIRITSDGLFYPCLMDQPQGNLLPALRPHFDGDRLDQLLAAGLQRKASEHPAAGAAVMTTIGG